MALGAGQSFEINEVTITQGTVTDEQQQWWKQNSGKSVDERSYSHLNPEQKFYLCLAAEGFKLNEAKDRARQLGMTNQELETAQEALALQVNDDDQVTAVTRPSFVGADLSGAKMEGTDLRGADLRFAGLRNTNLEGAKLWFADLLGADLQQAQMQSAILWAANLWGAQMQGADLQGTYLQGAKLRGAQMQGANLWGAKLQDAKMQGADLQGADLRLTDLSGAYFEHAKNLQSTKWDLAFYDATNPPKNLPDNITDKLLALDEPAYKTAKELQDAYREALVSDNETAITDAEKALTEHLGKCREENAKKAIQQAAPVLGAEAIPILVKKLAGSAVRVTDGLPTTAASPSDVSLGGDVNHYSQYGYGSR